MGHHLLDRKCVCADDDGLDAGEFSGEGQPQVDRIQLHQTVGRAGSQGVPPTGQGNQRVLRRIDLPKGLLIHQVHHGVQGGAGRAEGAEAPERRAVFPAHAGAAVLARQQLTAAEVAGQTGAGGRADEGAPALVLAAPGARLGAPNARRTTGLSALGV